MFHTTSNILYDKMYYYIEQIHYYTATVLTDSAALEALFYSRFDTIRKCDRPRQSFCSYVSNLCYYLFLIYNLHPPGKFGINISLIVEIICFATECFNTTGNRSLMIILSLLIAIQTEGNHHFLIIEYYLVSYTILSNQGMRIFFVLFIGNARYNVVIAM